MTDEDWKKHQALALAGSLEEPEPVKLSPMRVEFVRLPKRELPVAVAREAPSPYAKATRAVRVAYVVSIVSALINVSAGFFHSWNFVIAGISVASAFVWRHVMRQQRRLYGEHP